MEDGKGVGAGLQPAPIVFGAGLGASHQTGWTGIVTRFMHLFGSSTAEQFLEIGALAAVVEVEPT